MAAKEISDVLTTEKVLAIGRVSLRLTAPQERGLRRRAEPQARRNQVEVSAEPQARKARQELLLLFRSGDEKDGHRLGRVAETLEQQKELAAGATEEAPARWTKL